MGESALRILKRWPVMIFCALAVILILNIARGHGILGSAIEIGGDEHYEVSKSMLWAKGYPLYTRVWNDQPPLYTVILGSLFKCFGPSIGIARSLALLFGFLLLSGCFVFAKRRFGWLAACISTVCLIVAPGTVKYSVSAMLEVPATAIAIWAWWPLDQWSRTRRLYWLMLSGALFAVALQIKMTAIIFGPALFWELVIAAEGETRRLKVYRAIRNVALWLFCVSLIFLIIYFIFGDGFHAAWASHFSSKTRESAIELSFSTDVLLENPEILCCGAVGWIILILRKDWRRITFPLVIILTATVVHEEYRPWWSYYYIHFAIPLSWLSGYGLAELLSGKWHINSHRVQNYWVKVGRVVIGGGFLWQIGALGGTRLAGEISRIKSRPIVADSVLIGIMRHYGPQTKWVYAQTPIYAFHAGLLEIPEIAVLPEKRFWSGQISSQGEFAYVKQYRPEQLLINGNVPLELQNLVTYSYSLAYEDDSFKLYIANSVLHGN